MGTCGGGCCDTGCASYGTYKPSCAFSVIDGSGIYYATGEVSRSDECPITIKYEGHSYRVLLIRRTDPTTSVEESALDLLHGYQRRSQGDSNIIFE